MATYCLPRKYTAIFLKALQDKTLDPIALKTMSSADRRAEFTKLFGEDNAKEVNILFESKLLLKDFQKGMTQWARSLAGLDDNTKRSIVDKIQSLEKVLDGKDEQSFLADLTAKRLGVQVDAEGAQKLFDASEDVANKQETMITNPDDYDARMAYGYARLDLNDLVDSMKSQHTTFTDKIVNILSVPKSALTSVFHFSAPFVQGWGMMSTGRAWEGFGNMFKYFASEDNYRELQAWIISHPDYKFAQDGKLGLTELTDPLTTREEALQSTLVEKFNTYLSDKTGVPNLVRASSRGFTGYLNYVRFSRFTDLLNAARLTGEDVRLGSSTVRDLAKVVNDFTGRGALGADDKYANLGPLLNTVFFAPRKISATIEMFNPYNYLSPTISLTARNAAIRQMSGSLIATGAVLGIATAMGAKVDMNPISSDFAKINIGGEKLDLTGGNAIYLRLLARITTGQEITSSGKLTDLGEGYKAVSRAQLMGQYIRGKLSPVAGMLADYLYGSDPIGRPFDVTEEARDKLMPIAIGSFIDYWQNNPSDSAAILPSLFAIFGVSLESPLPAPSYKGVSLWGDASPVMSPAPRNNIDKEFERLGNSPGLPLKSINSVKLTGGQYRTYIGLAGQLAKTELTTMIQNPGWSSIPDPIKLSTMKSIMLSARKNAQDAILMQSRGTDNDILQKSLENKLKQQGIK